ncbi:MAG: MFS transporter [Candidatus Bathyarchaeia archaeon]
MQQPRTLKTILTVIPLMVAHQLYAADQVILGIVLTDIMRDIGLSMFSGGVVATLFGVGVLVGSMLAGWIIRRKGFKFSAFIGLFGFSIFTFLTGFSSSAWDLSLYRIGMGIGQGIWNVSYYSIIGTLFAKKRGFSTAIAGNMYVLGLFWAYPITTVIRILSGSWRLPLNIFGLIGFPILALIFLTLGSPKETLTKSHIEFESENLLSTLRNRNTLLGCFIGIFQSLIFFSVISFYPTYLTSALRFDPLLSGILMSIQTWSTFIASPIILFLSDRYGRKIFLRLMSLSLTPITYFMFNLNLIGANFTFTAIASIIYGAAISGSFPLALAFVQDSAAKAEIASATSLFTVAYYVGTIAAGPMTGYITFLLGWKATSLWLTTCCLISFLLAIMTKHSHTN